MGRRGLTSTPRHERDYGRVHIDNATAYDLARDLARKAGFRLHRVALQSESCYFEHPARPGLLMRLSMHKSSRSPIGQAAVVARASFSSKDMHLTEHAVYSTMRCVIGDYFLRDPEPSRYQGKKGTWENRVDDQPLPNA